MPQVAAPLDALQVRFSTSDMLKDHYQSMWSFSRDKLREIGARGVLAGWSLSLVKDSLGCGLFFCTFETIKSQCFYNFVTAYYGVFKPAVTHPIVFLTPEGRKQRTVIRPHYLLEPTAILLAGVAASIAQNLVQHPLTLIQTIHYQRLESLDYAAKLENSSTKMLQAYYNAYYTTFGQCKKLAIKAGGWRRYLYGGLIMGTIRQVPSTAAGLIVFEVLRRKYASDADVVIIRKGGYDILLT